MKVMNVRNKGFTLIELLVVVAIIVILIAILLPSLGAAKEQAQMVNCSSRLKQLVIAEHVYASENSGVVMAYYFESSAWVEYPWGIWLTQDNDQYIVDRKVLACPTYPPFTVDFGTFDARFRTYGIIRDIYPENVPAIADVFYGPYNAPGSSVYQIRYKISSATNATNIPFFADTRGNVLEDPTKQLFAFYMDPGFKDVSVVHLRHAKNTKANMAFMDGHAESLGQADLMRVGFNPQSFSAANAP